MITKNDVKKELINVMSEQHINILIDFANNFINTFGNRMTKEELLNRINKLNYIGFERKEYIDERCGNAEYATIKNPASLRTFIMKDYKLYNYQGEEINIGDLNIYNTNTSEYSLSTR